MIVEEAPNKAAPLVSRIIQHVLAAAPSVRSEQRDEPQMDFTERVRLLEQLLLQEPGRFLERFGVHLRAEHVPYFEALHSDDYALGFHLDQVRKRLADVRNILVKNRRYAALKKLVKDGVYFGESEMKSRNPLLYEHLVGQYMTEDECLQRDRENFQNMTLATFLMARFDKEAEAKLQQSQQENEDAVMWETNSDDEDEEEGAEKKEEEIEDKKLLLRQEFVTLMYNSFLQGKDDNFDYSSVDNNADYDDIKTKEQDEEETYFDSETPEVVQRSSSIGAASTNSTEEDELDAFMKTLPPTEKQIDT